MRNRKANEMAPSEEDSLEANSKTSDAGKTATSSSSCPFGLSGQSLVTGSKSSALQAIKKKEDEEEQLQQEQVAEQQDQWNSMHRAIGGADAPPQEQEQVQEQEVTPASSNANRCTKCNKKLGLTGGFPCRCGGVYCAVHRYSDRHECSFDYRELGANEIRRDNPQIVPSKLKKL